MQSGLWEIKCLEQIILFLEKLGHCITLEGTDYVIVPENGTPWSYAVPNVCRHVEVLGNGCWEGRLFGKTIKKENLSLELKYK